jgi:uncharacterized protein (TIGR02186 family)
MAMDNYSNDLEWLRTAAGVNLAALDLGGPDRAVKLFSEPLQDEGWACIVNERTHERLTLRFDPRERNTLGIWINRDSVAFEEAPSYYAALSARPVEVIAPEETLLRHQIGLANLRLRPAEAGLAPHRVAEFRTALIRNKIGRGLYIEDSGAVSMLTQAMFSTRVPLPAHIATGRRRGWLERLSRSRLWSETSLIG